MFKKMIPLFSVVAALSLTGLALATQSTVTQSSSRAVNDCCFEGAACCIEQLPCCDTLDCCLDESAACCGVGLACCKD
jgi:hypothetical protein